MQDTSLGRVTVAGTTTPFTQKSPSGIPWRLTASFPVC